MSEEYLNSSELKKGKYDMPLFYLKIPKKVVERFGLEEGDNIVFVEENGELKIKL